MPDSKAPRARCQQASPPSLGCLFSFSISTSSHACMRSSYRTRSPFIISRKQPGRQDPLPLSSPSRCGAVQADTAAVSISCHAHASAPQVPACSSPLSIQSTTTVSTPTPVQGSSQAGGAPIDPSLRRPSPPLPFSHPFIRRRVLPGQAAHAAGPGWCPLSAARAAIQTPSDRRRSASNDR